MYTSCKFTYTAWDTDTHAVLHTDSVAVEKITSVIDKWLAAVVNTDARLLATVLLSSLVSCSTRWYLEKREPQIFSYKTKNVGWQIWEP